MMSLRQQFTAALVTFAVALSAAGGFLAYRQASSAVEAELDRRAGWVAQAAADMGLQASLVTLLQPGYEDANAWVSIHNRLQRLRSLVPESYVLLEDNTALVTSFPADSIPIGTPLPGFDLYATEMEDARVNGHSTSVAFPGDDGRQYKWGFARLDDQSTVLAVLMPADYRAPVEQLARNLRYGSIAAALLAAVLALLLATSVVAPMERLSKVAIRIQRGHMDEPVATEGGREVGRLARAMERMRQGIQQRDEQLRLMLAQVAHEIRNPLGGVELLASAVADTEDAEERRRLIGRVRDEVRALNGIITEFLSFARPIERPDEPMDVSGEVREAAELVRMELGENGGSLQAEIPSQAMLVRAPEGQVKRATLNLLRNAAQASDTVVIRAENAGPQVAITVSDDGPGVAPELRERVFEPFVTDKQQGAGLGLAIVKKIAESTGGSVALLPSEETNGVGGAVFRVYFGNPQERRRRPRDP